jgi:hypothetical protein
MGRQVFLHTKNDGFKNPLPFAAHRFHIFVIQNAAQPRAKRVSSRWASCQSVKYQIRSNPEKVVTLTPVFSILANFEPEI